MKPLRTIVSIAAGFGLAAILNGCTPNESVNTAPTFRAENVDYSQAIKTLNALKPNAVVMGVNRYWQKDENGFWAEYNLTGEMEPAVESNGFPEELLPAVASATIYKNGLQPTTPVKKSKKPAKTAVEEIDLEER